ncbi:MAG: hypothetical protein ACXU7E_13310, partial [Croceibacterium sp.]
MGAWKLLTLCAGIALATVTTAATQDYPNRPVRIIVGFGPGAAADTPARLLAQKLGLRLGQQFVVEN